METVASEAPGGGFVLNGSKTWISSAPVAWVWSKHLQTTCVSHNCACSDVFVVWARCKWDQKVRGFLLEKVCGRMWMHITSDMRIIMIWLSSWLFAWAPRRVWRVFPPPPWRINSRCVPPSPAPFSWTTSAFLTTRYSQRWRDLGGLLLVWIVQGLREPISIWHRQIFIYF